MTARRRFLQRLALLLGSLAGPAACDRDGAAPARSADRIDRPALDAFVDTIVPADDDPGAVEAGISEILLQQFTLRPELEEEAVQLLERLDVVAAHHYRRGFVALTLEQRTLVVERTFRSRREDDAVARRAIGSLRSRIIEAFYLSPAGQAMIGYTPPYPGGYPDYALPPEAMTDA